MRIRTKRFDPHTGLGLVEVTISATILFILAASMVESVGQVAALGRTGSVEGRLQQGAQDAIRRITGDLKAAAFVSANGKSYPYLFVDGEANVSFAEHDHAEAVENAEDDDPDFGPNREIVFVRPSFAPVAQDPDGVNWDLVDEDGEPVDLPQGLEVVKRYEFPVIGADGTSGFQEEELSYVLVTAADGVNELQRRRDGESPEVIARGVERLVFDTSSTDPVGVPVGAVRVRLWLRLRDEMGTVHRHSAETVVRLQNGV
ncbi:MAG: hypothetical protein NTY35_13190 [Planctomycetota bacterium]|nr:hypothetical protein [Planctomycetota bacterium]